jgi:regulator of replication initiation timing
MLRHMGLSTKSGVLSEQELHAYHRGELQRLRELLHRSELENMQLRRENEALRAQLANMPDLLQLRWLETRQFVDKT